MWCYLLFWHLWAYQAFHLNCGFNCNDKCHLCDASDWENMTMEASWRSTLGNRRGKSPYWFDPSNIALLQIPGMNQENILPDSCHVCHLGWGLDLAASGLVLLAKRKCFGNGGLEVCLQLAYQNFTRWCTVNKKTTGISWWSTKKLDMPTCLPCSQHAIF